MESLSYIDLHCDTITMLRRPRENLERNKRMVTIQAMQEGSVLVQSFAAFVPTGYYPKFMKKHQPWKRFCKIADKKDELLGIHKDILYPVLCGRDIDICKENKKIGVLFTIEDSGVFNKEIGRIKEAYQRGVRIANLTWNHTNTIGAPNSVKKKVMEQGLTTFGIEVVEEMNRLGIIVDVSHLSDGGFWDVVKHCKTPFIATHSNSRAITKHPRNLTDEMIRTLSERGGVMGLNFAPHFLSDRGDHTSRMEDMALHVMHIRKVGGSQVLAIGSDFDGIHGDLEIATPAQLPLLARLLRRKGLTETELEAMWYGNVCRVVREVWK